MYSDQLVIKFHKAKKEREKTQKWFNHLDWHWVEDIPTSLWWAKPRGNETEPTSNESVF